MVEFLNDFSHPGTLVSFDTVETVLFPEFSSMAVSSSRQLVVRLYVCCLWW
ncbi:hypothetical protein OROHE_019612 [Orobanche hederae]